MNPANNRMRTLCSLILVAVGESVDPVPEGHIYAVLMGHYSLDEFQTAVSVGVDVGCLTREPGPCLGATEKLRKVCKFAPKAAA